MLLFCSPGEHGLASTVPLQAPVATRTLGRPRTVRGSWVPGCTPGVIGTGPDLLTTRHAPKTHTPIHLPKTCLEPPWVLRLCWAQQCREMRQKKLCLRVVSQLAGETGGQAGAAHIKSWGQRGPAFGGRGPRGLPQDNAGSPAW